MSDEPGIKVLNHCRVEETSHDLEVFQILSLVSLNAEFLESSLSRTSALPSRSYARSKTERLTLFLD
jgi:hypothetical protein